MPSSYVEGATMERSRTAALAALAGALVCGCSPFVPVVAVGDLPAPRQVAIRAVKVYEQAELAGVSWDNLGPLTGNSCQALLWHPPATRDDAMDQLKHWALEKGVTAIADVQCEAPVGMELETNCWSRVSCNAKAIRVKPEATPISL